VRAPEFWSRPGPLPALLSPLALTYAAAGRLRWALARPRRASVPVLCVGNAVAGGAGKTPTVQALCRRLRAAGRQPHVLSRGYGGRARGPLRVDPEAHAAGEVGDEALLLARETPTWIARDRPAGAAAAAAAGADIVVMDDGFQNPSLVKDLSLLVVDGGYGFGNGQVMPAGPLREPWPQALARADAVVLVGVDRHALGPRLEGRAPVLRASLRPTPAAAALAGCRVVAFAGIGWPEKFFATLEEMGCTVVARRPFADHHRYRPEEIMAICEQASDAGAEPVTTEKDAMRLPADARLMVRVLPVALEWQDEAAVDALLARLLPA